jgi:predicted DNA-binding transcriptional regulator YafY
VNRTDRLMGILLELQGRGELRAADLAQRFEVSVRTIYRDVEALCETGVPVVATPGKGYRLMEGYFLPPLSFSGSEAAVLALGAEFVRHRVDAELRRATDDALAKLFGVLPPEQREAVARWQRELLFSSFSDAPDDERLPRLRRAIHERRVARLLYHAYRRPAPEVRDVEPVQLIYLDGGWHLSAYCRLRRGLRFFRLDRIDGLQLLPERFTLERRHESPDHRRPRTEGFPEAYVRFEARVARWVRERQHYLYLRDEHDADGPLSIYALRDVEELLPWLLSWGTAVEVLSPPALRERLLAELRAMLARHDESEHLDEFSAAAAAPARMVSAALP